MPLTLFHMLNSRSVGTLMLLEELEADFELKIIKSGATREAEYLRVNPMGKVPAVLHNGQLITEQGAIFIYLADLFPATKLAPTLNDALRGPYLRWLVFYGSSFEPAVVDRALKREAAPLASSPYGDYDTMLKTLTDQLAKGPYLLGERFSAADVLWGSALTVTTGFGMVPKLPVIQQYIDRFNTRTAIQRVRAEEAARAAG